MAKQRDPVLDSMRGIGIVLMVLGHSGFPGTDYIYLFHMALFFMLSGWFFSLRGGLVHFVRRKLVTLWLPFVAANTVFTVCNNLFLRLNILTAKDEHGLSTLRHTASHVLAQAVKELFHAPDHPVRIIGIRHGEKMYETLLTNEECTHAEDMGDFYRVPSDARDLNYDKYVVTGEQDRNVLTEFNSSNTRLLSVEEVKEKLLALDYIQQALAAWDRL